jgi:hypothetical protein
MPKKDPIYIFVEDCSCSDETVKNHFLSLVEYKCVLCGCTEHNNRPLTLQLDHINGKHTDCRLENLRLLCPNCHSQTETFAGRQNWNNVSVTDEELIRALHECATITAALRRVGMDTGRTEYYGRANLLVKQHNIDVGDEYNSYNKFF